MPNLEPLHAQTSPRGDPRRAAPVIRGHYTYIADDAVEPEGQLEQYKYSVPVLSSRKLRRASVTDRPLARARG